MKRLFITGTDTGCGKTVISCALMTLAAQRGLQVSGMKPVAAGAFITESGLRNEDAVAIQQHCSKQTPYPQVNPICLPEPIAPHLQLDDWVNAAGGGSNPLALIDATYSRLAATAEIVIVEGVGGWRVPLTENTDIGDLCLQLQLPVILVVGMRLGCLNHALLSVEAIQHSGAHLAGWIANQVDPDMQALADNINSLQARIAAPLMGTVPFIEQFSEAAVVAHLKKGSLPF